MKITKELYVTLVITFILPVISTF